MCIGTAPGFTAISVKGNNFCDLIFASLDDRYLPKRGLLCRKRIFLKVNKLLTRNEKGSKTENDGLASLESIPNNFKI